AAERQMTLALPFKAGNESNQHPFVVLATAEPYVRSIVADATCSRAATYPALKGRATIIRPATRLIPSQRIKSLIQNLAPLFFHSAADLRARFRDRRKITHPFIGTTSIYDGTRAVTLLTFGNDRVERATPTAPNHFNIDLRIRTRRQSPQHIVRISHIDI